MFSFLCQFNFASNAATIVGGCLLRSEYKMRIPAAFISAFVISVSGWDNIMFSVKTIHP